MKGWSYYFFNKMCTSVVAIQRGNQMLLGFFNSNNVLRNITLHKYVHKTKPI